MFICFGWVVQSIYQNFDLLPCYQTDLAQHCPLTTALRNFGNKPLDDETGIICFFLSIHFFSTINMEHYIIYLALFILVFFLIHVSFSRHQSSNT